MKYLVVSDNHGKRAVLENLFAHYKDEVDYMIHCGDSEFDADDPLWQGVFVVTGNCDYDNNYHQNLVIETPLDKILVTHGHLYDVRFGLNRLSLKAQEVGANLTLFGHTHQIACEKSGDYLFLNPGSIAQPRGIILEKSYCIIESTKDEFNVQYFRNDFTKISNLSFIFKK
ncbi:MAG: metallophosphoesterase [Enterococcus lemanii]